MPQYNCSGCNSFIIPQKKPIACEGKDCVVCQYNYQYNNMIATPDQQKMARMIEKKLRAIPEINNMTESQIKAEVGRIHLELKGE